LSDPKKLPKTLGEALALASSLQGDLAERLAAYRAYAKTLRPDFAAAYDRLVTHLDALDAGKIGPRVGERMPDFLLPNQQGQLVSLNTFLDSGVLVISINRGHWCPYCKLDLRALTEIAPDIRRLGAQLVSITPEKAQFTKQAIADNDFPFPVLSDVDLSYTLSLGLIFWVGAEVKSLYADVGIDLERYQGNRSHFLPVAAKFIVGRDGTVKAREVNVDFRLRMDPKAIIDILASL
jgi:peroxiredoxin